MRGHVGDLDGLSDLVGCRAETTVSALHANAHTHERNVVSARACLTIHPPQLQLRCAQVILLTQQLGALVGIWTQAGSANSCILCPVGLRQKQHKDKLFHKDGVAR